MTLRLYQRQTRFFSSCLACYFGANRLLKTVNRKHSIFIAGLIHAIEGSLGHHKTVATLDIMESILIEWKESLKESVNIAITLCIYWKKEVKVKLNWIVDL